MNQRRIVQGWHNYIRIEIRRLEDRLFQTLEIIYQGNRITSYYYYRYWKGEDLSNIYAAISIRKWYSKELNAFSINHIQLIIFLSMISDIDLFSIEHNI